jgi:hypothetical protein
MQEGDMASEGSTSLSQSKTRYLRNLIEHCHGYLEEGCMPEQADLYMRLLFDAEDELRNFERNKKGSASSA